MKNLKKFPFAVLCLLIAMSCSNSDDDGGTIDDQNNYFPITATSDWDYNVVATDNINNETFPSTDYLFVVSQSGNTATLNVNDLNMANGVINGIITSGTVTKNENSLLVSGTLDFLGGFTEFELDFTNLVLYNAQLTSGTQLWSESDSFVQDIQGIPLTVDYTLSTTQLGASPSMTVNGVNYETITSANLKLRLTVSGSVAGVSQNIIDEDVLDVDTYFAKDVGIIKSESQSGYTISPATIAILELLGIDLTGLPTSASVTNVQELTDYSTE